MKSSGQVVVGMALGIIAARIWFDCTEKLLVPYIMLAVCEVGSLLPDIDDAESDIWERLPFVHFMAHFFVKPKGFMHSLLGLGILTAIFFWAFGSIPITIAFALGYASHLFLDMLVIDGIQLFFPSKKMIGFGLIQNPEGPIIPFCIMGFLAASILFFFFA